MRIITTPTTPVINNYTIHGDLTPTMHISTSMVTLLMETLRAESKACDTAHTAFINAAAQLRAGGRAVALFAEGEAGARAADECAASVMVRWEQIDALLNFICDEDTFALLVR